MIEEREGVLNRQKVFVPMHVVTEYIHTYVCTKNADTQELGLQSHMYYCMQIIGSRHEGTSSNGLQGPVWTFWTFLWSHWYHTLYKKKKKNENERQKLRPRPKKSCSCAKQGRYIGTYVCTQKISCNSPRTARRGGGGGHELGKLAKAQLEAILQ